jgi:hypothetical protein
LLTSHEPCFWNSFREPNEWHWGRSRQSRTLVSAFTGAYQRRPPEPPAADNAVREPSASVADQPPVAEQPSLAVLPFLNLSGDREQEYFADGMVEKITTALARVRWLSVVARNSSFTYKGRNVDLKQVGRELGVRYVLER